MYFLYLTLGLISAFASLAVAEDAQIVHCGTTSDATLSDCHNLIDNVDTWNAARQLSVYVARDSSIDRETTRLRAQALFGCGSVDANKINVLGIFDTNVGVCISDGNGCGDCFEDSDFAKVVKRDSRRRLAIGRERK